MKTPIYLSTAAALLLGGPALGADDEAPAARIYLRWVQQAIEQTRADLPAISAAAEKAAVSFVAGKGLGVRGGAGMNDEMGGRAGGFVSYKGGGGNPGDVILYCFGVATAAQPDAKKLLETELADAEKARADHSVVIGIASLEQLKSFGVLERARRACSALLDNHAPAEDGLMRDKSGKAVIPTYTVADPIVAWTWAAELFAACTRLGKTPTVYQTIMIDTKLERYKRYQNQPFHADIHVEPQEAKKLGGEYLAGLAKIMTAVGDASWKNLAEASHCAAGTIEQGGKSYLFLFGHYPPHHPPGVLAHDPGLFVKLNESFKILVTPGAADYVVAVGYGFGPDEMVMGQPAWADPAKLRCAGRGVAWVAASFRFRPQDFADHEILVDQQWGEGDALVNVPGYDVKICPPSGVVAEAMRWMITAETWIELEKSAATPPPDKH